ncbi:MAG: hypothetical protein AAGA48_32385 [Myxococcota bacterium]
MDQYSSPDPEVMAFERGQMQFVRYATILLWVLVTLDILGFLGAIAGAIGLGLNVDDPTELIGQLVGIVCLGLMLLVFAVPQIAAAIGLRSGSKWAWYLTIGIGALYVLSCCNVLWGAALLFFMLNDEVRTTFQEI